MERSSYLASFSRWLGQQDISPGPAYAGAYAKCRRLCATSRKRTTVAAKTREQRWLPKLAPLLPLPIPVPLAIGKLTEEYPWQWSIYQWLPGDSAANAPISDLNHFATSLAEFLIALQRIDSAGGPSPGLHSFYRGGSLATYDAETRQALAILKGKIDVVAAAEIWETALATDWDKPPVWVHGDISLGNLLVKNGQLCAVIDFGQLTVYCWRSCL